MNNSVKKSGRQDTHSEMRSTGSTGGVDSQAVRAVRTVAGSNKQAWRGHCNLVGAQGRTQLHEHRQWRGQASERSHSRKEPRAGSVSSGP